MTLAEIRQNEIEYCKSSVEYFIDTYGHIEDKDAEELIQPFDMWGAQREALKSIMENRLNAILKARQLGFSWLVMHISAWLLLCFTGRTVIGLSRTEEEAKELVRRLGVIFTYMPELIADINNQPTGWTGPVFRTTALELTVIFPDGPVSVFKAFPSSPNAARSFTADLIIFDEWAFQQFADEIWTAAFPVINRPYGGKVIGLSTIDRGSLFEEIFTNPDNGFNKIFIPWYADPRRDDKWYESTKRALGDLITQEYPASIEEALTVPGGAFFPEVNDKNTVTKEAQEGRLVRYVSIDYGLDMFAAHWISINEYGEAQVYREYDKPGTTISEAAGILLSLSEEEEITLFLAPPDLWNRSPETGKSRAQLWAESGVNLTKTSNDFAAGCASMKEWLKPRENQKSRLTILEGSAPNLYRCLQKIQKDKKKPNVYAKEPHDLTHDPDSLRYFCAWWTIAPDKVDEKRKKFWTPDRIEDYDNANEEGKRYLIEKYGEPIL